VLLIWEVILPVLSKHMTKTQLSVLFIWLSVTVAAFVYFIDSKLVSFNFDNKLSDVGHQQLANSLKQYIEPTDYNTILHFYQPNCQCQQYSEAHIQDINNMAEANNFSVKNINIKDHMLVPATPSVAILNNSGEIVYFGPYGEGLACSQTSGYAQTILNNFIKGYDANLIIKEAEGCYCKV